MRSFPDFRRRAPRPHDHRGVVRASNRGNSKLRCYIRRDPPFIRTASFSSKPWGEELDSVRLRPAPSSRVEKRSGAQPHAAWVPAETSDDGRWPDGAPGRVTPAHPGGGPSFAREVAADRGHFAFPLAGVVLQSCSKDRTRRHVLLFDDSLGSEENDFTTGSLSRRRECGPRAARRTAFLPVYRSTARKELPLTCQITPTGPRSDPARRHANQRQRPGEEQPMEDVVPANPRPAGLPASARWPAE